MSSNKKQYAIFVAVLIIACAASFYAGTLSSAKKAKTDTAQGGKNTQFGQYDSGSQNGQRQGRVGSQMRGGGVSGEILSNDGTTITVKMRDGGSRIVLLSGSTKIEKNIEGTSKDLEVGKNVIVSGEQNQDGSFTATSIQLRQAMLNIGQAEGNKKVQK